MTGDVVWGVIWMLAILLVGVCVTIYYIFMYDAWYPNEQRSEDSSSRDTSGEIVRETEGAH